MRKKSIFTLFSITLFFVAMLNFYVPSTKAVIVPEDGYEDNDAFGSAVEISPGIYKQLALYDEDWFMVWGDSGRSLNVTIWFDGSVCDMDFEIYDQSDVLQSSSIVAGVSYQNLYYNLPAAGYYYIRIYSQNGYYNESYNLLVEVIGGGTTADDVYEDNDGFSSAAPITPGLYTNLTQGDVDIWSFVTSVNDNILIDVVNDSADTFTVELYNATYDLIVTGWDNTTINGWSIEYNVSDTAGLYFLMVKGSNVPVNYSIDFRLANGTVTPADDVYEENDNAASAALIQPGYYSNLVQLDPDYYSFYLNGTGTITVKFYFNDALGNMWANLYEPGSAYSVTSTSYDSAIGAAVLSYNATISGNYTIEVFGDNTGIIYDLELIVELDVIVPDDSYEDNDDFNSATQIAPNSELTDLIQVDNDYYVVSVTEGYSYSIRVFTKNYTLLDPFEVYDYYYRSLGTAQEVESGIWDFTIQNIQYSGDLYILVNGTGEGAVYNISVQESASLVDDSFEPNDIDSEAAIIQINQNYTDLALLNDDWYKFTISDQDADFCKLDIIVRTNASNPDLEVLVYEGDDTGSQYYLFTLNQSVDDSNSLIGKIVGSKPATYYIELRYNGNDFQYNLTLMTINDCCPVDDRFEDNDQPTAAATITAGEYIDLILCDDDFYIIRIEANTIINITIDFELNGDEIYCTLYEAPQNIPLTPLQVYTGQSGRLSMEWFINESNDYILFISHKNMYTPIKYYLGITLTPTSTSSGSTETTSSETSETTNSTTELNNPFGAIDGFPVEIVSFISLTTTFVFLAVIIRKKRRFKY